jgi:hypothetical protein
VESAGEEEVIGPKDVGHLTEKSLLSEKFAKANWQDVLHLTKLP